MARFGNSILPQGALSSDGYIIRQDLFSDFEYRTVAASGNGCGFIACYNLRHFLGHDVTINEVREELNSMMPRFRGPTFMRTMRKYFKKHIPNYREFHGRENCLLHAKSCSAGIFRYYEEKIPHFVTFIRTGKDRFRFFNVNDEGMEDFESGMDEFGKAHMTFGPVSLLCVNVKPEKR